MFLQAHPAYPRVAGLRTFAEGVTERILSWVDGTSILWTKLNNIRVHTCPPQKLRSRGGLNKNSLPRLMYLNVWFSVNETVWEELGGARPWWQRCQWRRALRFQKSTRFPESCRSVSYWGPFLICWKRDCSRLRNHMRLALFCRGVYPCEQSMVQGALCLLLVEKWAIVSAQLSLDSRNGFHFLFAGCSGGSPVHGGLPRQPCSHRPFVLSEVFGLYFWVSLPLVLALGQLSPMFPRKIRLACHGPSGDLKPEPPKQCMSLSRII